MDAIAALSTAGLTISIIAIVIVAAMPCASSARSDDPPGAVNAGGPETGDLAGSKQGGRRIERVLTGADYPAPNAFLGG
jgi:hypothetical protein